MNIREFFVNIHSEMRGAEYSVRYYRRMELVPPFLAFDDLHVIAKFGYS